MRNHMATGLSAALVLLACSAEWTFAQAPAGKSADFWRTQALSYIDQIDKDDPRDRALYELSQVQVLAGDLAGASKGAPRIKNPQLRCLAHFQIAKYYELAGDYTAALAELQRARPVAVSRGFTYQMVDAFLDTAKSPELARAYVSEMKNVDRGYAWQAFARALALRGNLDQALQVVDREVQASSRQRTLASMGSAAAERAHVDHAIQIAEIVTDAKLRDGIWLSLVRALKQRSQDEEAKAFVARISDPLMRADAESILGQVAGQPVDEVTAESLRQQIAEAKSAKVKRKLYDSLLKKQMADKDVPGAEATIEAIVKLIEDSKFEAENSKFGNLDDSVRISMARSNYLQLAGVLAELGEQEASRKMLARAEQVIVNMSDSSGMGKMMLVPVLLHTQLGLGDLDGARRTVTTTQPIFWRVEAGAIASQFLELGDIATAKFVAESVLENKSAGGADVVSSFLHAGHSDMALDLLDRVDDSYAGAAICREVGQAMIELDKSEELRTWLTRSAPAAQANLCIGAARTTGTFLEPATSDLEQAVVKYLTVPAEDLPEGAKLSEEPYPNPGIHPLAAVPGMAVAFQHYRQGESVNLKSAATAFYKDGKGQVEVRVTCYELADAARASQVLQETYIAPHKDWYVQKGRFLIFVSSRQQTPKCLLWREEIHKALESRDLAWK